MVGLHLVRQKILRKNEINIEQDCLLWGYRLIIPYKFRAQILKELRSSHMGIVKMKSLARLIMSGGQIWIVKLNRFQQIVKHVLHLQIIYKKLPYVYGIGQRNREQGFTLIFLVRYLTKIF